MSELTNTEYKRVRVILKRTYYKCRIDFVKNTIKYLKKELKDNPNLSKAVVEEINYEIKIYKEDLEYLKKMQERRKNC